MKSSGYNVRVLDFRNLGHGDYWNPLRYAYELYKTGNTNKAQELISDFITTLSDTQRNVTNDMFWVYMSCSFATGILMLMLECADEDEMNVKTFGQLCSGAVTDELELLVEKIPKNSIAVSI